MPDTSSPLILPGDPEFDWTLATSLPPDWRAVADRIGEYCTFVASVGSGGVLRPATPQELDEYLWGGEYDERLLEIDEEDDWE